MAAHAEAAAKTTGMFSDDGVRTFMSQLKTLTDDCFTELNTLVASQYTNPAERQARFKKGLNTIENWDAQVRGEETSHALERFPSINEQYKHSVVTYVKSTLSGSGSDNVRVRIPPFDMFLFYLFREIARSSVMRNGEYFSMSYLDRDAYMCDIVHIVMRDCAQVISNDSQSKASTGTTASSRMTSWRQALASMDAVKVLPGDSVSCIQPPSKVPTKVPVQVTAGGTTHTLDDGDSKRSEKQKSVAPKPDAPSEHRSVILGEVENDQRSVLVSDKPAASVLPKRSVVAEKPEASVSGRLEASVVAERPVESVTGKSVKPVTSVVADRPATSVTGKSVKPAASVVAEKPATSVTGKSVKPATSVTGKSVKPAASVVAEKPAASVAGKSVKPAASVVAATSVTGKSVKPPSVVESVRSQPEWVVERQSVAVQTIETGDTKSVMTKLTVVQPPAEELLKKPPSVIVTKKRKTPSTTSRSVNLDQSLTGHRRVEGSASRSAVSSSDDED